MIVTRSKFFEVLVNLVGRPVVCVDTETTGLRPYHGDRPIGIGVDEYYFNFKEYPGASQEVVLGEDHRLKLRDFFETERTWILANAKFDVSMLEEDRFGRLNGKWFDALVVERLLDDLSHSLNLEEIAPKYGAVKDMSVDKLIDEKKLYTMEQLPGRKTPKKNKHFDRVPLEIIAPYCTQDIKATTTVAIGQLAKIKAIDSLAEPMWPKLRDVYENECRLLQVVYDMEKTGIAVDRDFCRKAIDYEHNIIDACEETFQEQTGKPFKKSGKLFAGVFAGERDRWSYTGKGNPSFDDEVLERFRDPLAGVVRRHSKAKSNINYYQGFLYQCDAKGIIHSSLNQHQARTGRFSSSNPNLQNLKKHGVDLTQPYVVRRALVPRKDGNFLGMIDYDQVEYRMMVDYAGALGLVDMILNQGLDVHSATAEIAGIPRQDAKNVNFGIVYGQGNASLAQSLGVTEEEAKSIKSKVLAAAPEIERFISTVKYKAVRRGFIYNWLGRRYHYDRSTAYKAPNGLIQGGAADVIKVAMPRCADFLKREGYKTKLILCIHDELVFEGPREELHVLPMLRDIMESVYPHKYLKLTAGIDVSFKSLADKQAYEEVV